MSENKTTPAPAAAVTKGRRSLPEIQRVYASKAELDTAQIAARAAGHDKDVRKFAVTCNGKTSFVLSYNPAYAVYHSYKQIGIQIEELDPTAATWGMNPAKMAAKLAADPDGLAKLDEKSRKALLEALTGKKK